jgi:PBSX family phage terminase large subunit
VISINDSTDENTVSNDNPELTGREKSLANLIHFKPNNPETGERDERINRTGVQKYSKKLSRKFDATLDLTVGDVLKIYGKKTRVGKKLAAFPPDMTLLEILAKNNVLDAIFNPNQARILNILFERLEGKSSEKGLDGDSDPSEIKHISLPAENIPANFIDLYRDIINHGHTEYLLRGGRSSGKSTTLALILIVLFVNNPEWNILVCRQVADTLRSSCYNTLRYAISTLGLDEDFHATLSPLEITYKDGRKIFFRGLDAPEKLKSLRPEKGTINVVWFEEASEVHGQEVLRNVVQSAIRGTNEGFTFLSYNPPRVHSSWVNKYAAMPRPDRYDHYSCYKDLPRNWVGEAFYRQAEILKELNPEAYAHEYEGAINGLGNTIFQNLELRTITDEEIKNFDNILNGLDFGYVHASHYSKVHFDSERLTLYVFGELRKYKTSNKDLYDAMVEYGYRPQDLLVADSAEPRSIAELANYGAYVLGATKGVDSLRFSIRWLQGLAKIVIDPVRCSASAQEFQDFAYLQTKDGETVEQFPNEKDDSIAAVRYACNTYWIRAGQE